MELEMKILRDKVLEDGTKSGIESLLNDDKDAQVHIRLLKEKYIQMHNEFNKQFHDSKSKKLNIIGT